LCPLAQTYARPRIDAEVGGTAKTAHVLRGVLASHGTGEEARVARGEDAHEEVLEDEAGRGCGVDASCRLKVDVGLVLRARHVIAAHHGVEKLAQVHVGTHGGEHVSVVGGGQRHGDVCASQGGDVLCRPRAQVDAVGIERRADPVPLVADLLGGLVEAVALDAPERASDKAERRERLVHVGGVGEVVLGKEDLVDLLPERAGLGERAIEVEYRRLEGGWPERDAVVRHLPTCPARLRWSETCRSTRHHGQWSQARP